LPGVISLALTASTVEDFGQHCRNTEDDYRLTPGIERSSGLTVLRGEGRGTFLTVELATRWGGRSYGSSMGKRPKVLIICDYAGVGADVGGRLLPLA